MSETEDVASRAGAAAADSGKAGEEADADHADLDDLPDGSGCAEIWDYLSERRRD